jgi:hypothetical protein
VVYQQEFQDPILSFLHRRAVGNCFHALCDRQKASGGKAEAARAFHIDEAHPAHPDWLHPGVVTKTRDVRPEAVGHSYEQLALFRLYLPTVDGDMDAVGRGRRDRVMRRGSGAARAGGGGGGRCRRWGRVAR